MNHQLCEQLLNSWLGMSSAVRNERLVKTMTFREVLVCHILYRKDQENQLVTPTDIVEITDILKSQVNRVIGSLEEKKYIIRDRSSEDKRQIFLHLSPQGLEAYQTEHEHVLHILANVVNHLGEAGAASLIEHMDAVSLAMKNMQ